MRYNFPKTDSFWLKCVYFPSPQAESMLAADDTLNKEYLSMGGLQSFTDATMRLVLGNINNITLITSQLILEY